MIPERGHRLLPAVSALLAVGAFPPFHLLIPSFVALVPLALWVADQNDGRDASGRVFLGGVWFGVLYFGLLLYWIPLALAAFTWWAVPAYLTVVMVLALGAGCFTWSLRRLTRRGGIPLWLALPLTWTALEWVRAHAPGGLAFPWLGLGTSLTGYPELVGAAELVGARGITLWLALLNGLIAEGVRAARALDRTQMLARWATAFAFVLAVPAAWGYWRASTLPIRAVGEVAVVQPNVAAQFRLDGGRSNDSTIASLTRLLPEGTGLSPGVPDRDGLPPGLPEGTRFPLDLVVWPEVTFFGPIESDDTSTRPGPGGRGEVDRPRRLRRDRRDSDGRGWSDPDEFGVPDGTGWSANGFPVRQTPARALGRGPSVPPGGVEGGGRRGRFLWERSGLATRKHGGGRPFRRSHL